MDPWDWNVEEVVDAFCKSRNLWSDARHLARLPDPQLLEVILRNNHVDGDVLLTDIEDHILKDHWHIASLGQRSTIMSAILKLRHISNTYSGLKHERHKSEQRSLSSPIQYVSQQPSERPRILRPSSSRMSSPKKLSVGSATVTVDPDLPDESHQNIATEDKTSRTAQTQGSFVVDSERRKRRKIAPTLITTGLFSLERHQDSPRSPARHSFVHAARTPATQANLQAPLNIASPPPDTKNVPFLSRESLPIDTLFFGPVPKGQGRDVDGIYEEDTHQFNYNFTRDRTIPLGCQQYVLRRLKHFLLDSDEVEVQRDGRVSIAIIPYKTDLVKQGDPCSALLFQGTGDDMIVTHEYYRSLGQKHLHSPVIDNRPSIKQSQTLGDWDVLAHWANEDDTVLPLYGDSSSEISFSESLIEEMQEDDLSTERETQPLNEDEVMSIIKKRIDQYAETWRRKKLPLKEHSAWSIWRKAKGWRMRNHFKFLAQNEANRLQERLEKLKEFIVKETWQKPGEVERQCSVLEETVQQYEEQAWKASLWARSKAPERLHGTLRTRKRTKVVAMSDDDGFILDENSEEVMSDELPDVNAKASAAEAFLGPNCEVQPVTLNGTEVITMHEIFNSNIISDTDNIHDEKQDPLAVRSSDATITPFLRLTQSIKRAQVECTPPGNISKILWPPPEHATFEEIDRWNFGELMSRHDRKRLVIKLLYDMGLRTHQKISKWFAISEDDDIDEGIMQCLKSFQQFEFLKGFGTQPKIIDRVSKLFLCWWECSEKNLLVDKRQIQDAVSELFGSNEKRILEEIRIFSKFVCRVLEIWANRGHGGINSTLQSEISPIREEKALDTEMNTIDLTIEGDDHTPSSEESQILKTSSKRRTKEVKRDQAAVLARQAARARQQEADLHRQDMKIRQVSSQDMATNFSRIAINPGCRDEEAFIYINDKIASRIKEHQVEGIQFLWRELITGGKQSQDGEFQGCLLAHTMGLGKTMQTITFLVTLAAASQSTNSKVRAEIPTKLRQSRSLIACPPSLIQNWYEEFNIWAPKGGQGNVGTIFMLSPDQKNCKRLDVILEWYEEGGVLIIGYEMLCNLVTGKGKEMTDDEKSMVRKQLLEGPNVVVLDEAHGIRNKSTKKAGVCSQFKSRSRIALTGSPLSNNLEEYFEMINWIAPGYLGSATEFRAWYKEPIEDGGYEESTSDECRLAMKRLRALNEEITPKVHRADITVLKDYLPSKTEFVLTTSLTPLQAKAYTLYVQYAQGEFGEKATNATVWACLDILALLCAHPKIFSRKLENLATSAKEVSDSSPTVSPGLIKAERELFVQYPQEMEAIASSAKISLLLEIVQLSKAAGDQVLVFSHKISTLDYLKALLENSDISYAYLDGKTKTSYRQNLTKEFGECGYDVFLISTKAGGLGLNLPTANRVVLFDFCYNPTWEEQAVGRAYRMGQTKPVYVYRFLLGGTFEEKVNNTAIFKTQLATRAVDKKNPKSAASKAKDLLFIPREVPQRPLEEYYGKDPLVLDQMLNTTSDIIRAITTTETFRIDSGDDLAPEELQEVAQMKEAYRNRGAVPFITQAPNTMEATHGLGMVSHESFRDRAKIEQENMPNATTDTSLGMGSSNVAWKSIREPLFDEKRYQALESYFEVRRQVKAPPLAASPLPSERPIFPIRPESALGYHPQSSVGTCPDPFNRSNTGNEVIDTQSMEMFRRSGPSRINNVEASALHNIMNVFKEPSYQLSKDNTAKK